MNTFLILRILKLFILLISFTEICDSANTHAVYHNPIFDHNTPDPYVYLHTDGFYYYSHSTNSRIIIYKSRELTNFRNSESAYVFECPPGFGALWAPEIHFVDGNWYIYFTMDDGDDMNHRMYVIRALSSSNPLGRYSSAVKLAPSSEDFRAIDGTLLQYGNGNYYIMWSGSRTLTDLFPQIIYIAQMTHPMQISGERVLIREPLYDWEMWGVPVTEGPQIIQHEGRTFVVFSASGSGDPNYCLGIMGIDDLKDPLVPTNWWHNTEGCVFWRNDEQSVFATGHASFTLSPDKTESWMVYHAMQDANGGWGNRTARAEKFVWTSDNYPNFPRPSGFDVPLETPSGQL